MTDVSRLYNNKMACSFFSFTLVFLSMLGIGV